MSYTPPDAHNIVYNFEDGTYSPPDAHNIVFDFGATHTTTQYISVDGLNSLEIGQLELQSEAATIVPLGFNASSFGGHKLIPTQIIKPTGYLSTSFGNSQVWNFNKEIKTSGFNSLIFGSALKVYNLKQITSQTGFNSALYGTPFLQGGVKYIYPSGHNTLVFGSAQVVNTRADQYIQGQGIVPPSLSSPIVSPRFVRPVGIKSDSFGQPLFQRSPSPLGFETSLYGVAWISHSPRYLLPGIVDGFNVGYPTVYDPTQKVLLDGKGIEGGIFGDTAIRNTRRILNIEGIDSAQFSNWAIVESNLRNITEKGFDAQSIGISTIQNKTPSLNPSSFDSFAGLNASVGYRVREVKPNGFYQPKFGLHTLEKPPEINVNGFNANGFGTAVISNFKRELYVGLGDSLTFGDDQKVWFRYRNLYTTEFKADAYGNPRVEHGVRTLLAQGAEHSSFGNSAWVSFLVREILPISIAAPFIPVHRVGRSQEIKPLGFDASAFGERIIPESQALYPQGFSNTFGLSKIDLRTKYIEPKGFLTFGLDPTQRFGSAKFWNLKQYIVQTFDTNNGLVPPILEGWTSIENRNKTIGAIGNNQSRIGSALIENNARLIQPMGIDALNFNKPLIADRVRSLKLEGIESPYISGWTVIYNDARVISISGFNSQGIGNCTFENTRRHYPRVGNFESLEMGLPIIGDRIRTLSIESRHSIEPPAVPLPKVDLYTRYIDEVGRNDDYMTFGNPSLTIHWNIIYPRWTLRDAYGFPTVKNLTPEIPVFGHNSEEFGNTFVRTQWRSLQQIGTDSQLFGQSEIAYRNKKIAVSDFNQSAFGKPKVIKTGIPPYFPQYIWLDAVEMDGAQMDGHGIQAPKNQVSQPSLRSNVIFPSGFNASEMGQVSTQSNGILVESGIQELNVGSHSVGLKNRTISVSSLGDLAEVSTPRFTPHTVYAVMEAPEQAIKNHDAVGLHYVNSDMGSRPPGEVFGKMVITLQHRVLRVAGLGNVSRMGTGHKLMLRKQIVNVERGIASMRLGFHTVGPFEQNLEQFDSVDSQSFGRLSISHKSSGPLLIKPTGIVALALAKQSIDLFIRSIYPNGMDMMTMGARKSGDTPFMWQGLRIGELVKGNYGGFDSQQFGQTWISLKVRELKLDGFDSFVCEYDYTAFDQRMRVRLTEIPKPVQGIQCVGFDAFNQGVPNIKPAVHYIRPDGNADQFRKGAF